MLQKLLNVFKIPELRNKLLFTLAMLVVYRIGFYVPLPGVNAPALNQTLGSTSDSALGALSNYLSTFSGGSLGQSTIFGLGIMPYISASIILQLMGTVVPSLEKLKKEGEPGMRKINEWTRYLTVGVCFVQSFMWVSYLLHSNPPLIYLSVHLISTPQLFLASWASSSLPLAPSSSGGSANRALTSMASATASPLIITAGILSPHARCGPAYGYTRSPFKGVIESFFGGIFIGLASPQAGGNFSDISKNMKAPAPSASPRSSSSSAASSSSSPARSSSPRPSAASASSRPSTCAAFASMADKSHSTCRSAWRDHGGVMPIIFARLPLDHPLLAL